uniref:Uncharacterized protein n=1 Tax=Caenorhabditis japonica TaxID=281687 RepID=A0A8R1I254_CAEJA
MIWITSLVLAVPLLQASDLTPVSLRITIFGEQESVKKDLKTEFKSRARCKTLTTEPTSCQNMNESLVLSIVEQDEQL